MIALQIMKGPEYALGFTWHGGWLDCLLSWKLLYKRDYCSRDIYSAVESTEEVSATGKRFLVRWFDLYSYNRVSVALDYTLPRKCLL